MGGGGRGGRGFARGQGEVGKETIVATGARDTFATQFGALATSPQRLQHTLDKIQVGDQQPSITPQENIESSFLRCLIVARWGKRRRDEGAGQDEKG